MRIQHRCFPVHIAEFVRIPFLKDNLQTVTSANLKVVMNQRNQEKTSHVLISAALKAVFKSRLKAPSCVEIFINSFMNIKRQMKEMTDLIKTTQTNENKSEFHLKDFDLVTFNLIIKKFDKYEIFKKRKRKTSTLEVDLIDTTTKNLA